VRLEANARRLAKIRSQLVETREQIRAGSSARQRLHDSAYARLQAQLDSLPVIEQAKGILMAQRGCSAEDAFDLLRSASQRTNTRVREVATEIVRRTESRGAAVTKVAR
jgi:AmiR/NasT family two-component response regulator